MKIKDFMEKTGFKFSEDSCGVCDIHEAFYDKGEVECPVCCSMLDITDLKTVVVGETNVIEMDEEIIKAPYLECYCGTHIAFIPTPIIWNANHDVYYTGGRHYLTDSENIDFKDKLLPSIQQYHERLLKGEKLQPWNLEMWLRSDIEHIIADYMYKHGLKK